MPIKLNAYLVTVKLHFCFQMRISLTGWGRLPGVLHTPLTVKLVTPSAKHLVMSTMGLSKKLGIITFSQEWVMWNLGQLANTHFPLHLCTGQSYSGSLDVIMRHLSERKRQLVIDFTRENISTARIALSQLFWEVRRVRKRFRGNRGMVQKGWVWCPTEDYGLTRSHPWPPGAHCPFCLPGSADRFSQTLPSPVSQMTVRRRLHALGMHNRAAVRKPPIGPRQPAAEDEMVWEDPALDDWSPVEHGGLLKWKPLLFDDEWWTNQNVEKSWGVVSSWVPGQSHEKQPCFLSWCGAALVCTGLTTWSSWRRTSPH